MARTKRIIALVALGALPLGLYAAADVAPAQEGDYEPAADVSIDAGPKFQRVGPKAKKVRYEFQAGNLGAEATGLVRLCVWVPKRRLTVRNLRCLIRDLDAGDVVQRVVRLRIKPAARGKTTRVRMIVRGRNIVQKRAFVRLRVRGAA